VHVTHDSNLSFCQVARTKLIYLTSTPSENSQLDLRGLLESAHQAVSMQILIVLLSLPEIFSLTPWVTMAASSWERMVRYYTIKVCSICVRPFPEPWLASKKSHPRTSRACIIFDRFPMRSAANLSRGVTVSNEVRQTPCPGGMSEPDFMEVR